MQWLRKRTNYLLERKVYVAKYADDSYREILVSSREGINQTAESIKVLDDVVSPLIKKVQSIAHIYAHHTEEIHYSRRTLYTYIDKSVFSAHNLDLRRRVKYRPRKKGTQRSIVNLEMGAVMMTFKRCLIPIMLPNNGVEFQDFY